MIVVLLVLWLLGFGSQIAAAFSALGVSLGAFNLLSPALLGVGGDLAMKMAGMGFLSIQAKAVRDEVPA